MENQALGLAEALGGLIVIKRIHLPYLWSLLCPYFPIRSRVTLAPIGDSLSPPFPEVLIGCGRQSILSSIAIRQASQGRTLTIQLQNPVIRTTHFDLVIVPIHDRLHHPNVLQSRGALHRVTEQRLAQARQDWMPRLAHLPGPFVGIFIGGSSKVYRLTSRMIHHIIDQLIVMSRRYGCSILVTPSRRTSLEHQRILRDRLSEIPSMVWDQTGDNPYFGFLSAADTLIVTCDSVSMISEACSTGKPVYLLMLKGGSKKFRRFHEDLQQAGMIRPFTGQLDTWTYTPLRETQRIAEEIKPMLEERLARYSHADIE